MYNCAPSYILFSVTLYAVLDTKIHLRTETNRFKYAKIQAIYFAYIIFKIVTCARDPIYRQNWKVCINAAWYFLKFVSSIVIETSRIVYSNVKIMQA